LLHRRTPDRVILRGVGGGDRFDVAVVGASLGGCTAARFYALRGARVALIEQRPDPGAWKVVCTHAIQSSAAPTIERLGLAPLLEERGAVRIAGELWSPYGGWVHAPADAPRGWGVTRRTLDPLLRSLAAETPGVELMTGLTAVGLPGDGVAVASSDGEHSVVRARLVVGADGRNSTVARLAGVRGRVRPHGRFFYFAYWRGVRPEGDVARIWLLDPDGGAHFPNEDGITLLAVGATKARLPAFRADLERAYLDALAALPDGPQLEGAERVSKIVGKLDMPNVIRPAAAHGVAFVGDAALATDPLFGVGCGWAFQSAEWLVDETAGALLDGGDLDAALRRYRRTFLRRLGPHHWQIADYASGRPIRRNERALYRAGARDPVVNRAVEAMGSRRHSPLRALDPRLLPRVLRAQVPLGNSR
jgi:flavin-dependent dehydrogenase